VSTIGHLLFLTSVFAGLLAFLNTTNRYFYALGREGVLPRILARTSLRTGAPVAASITQTVIGFVAIVVYAVMGWDPLVQMMFYLATVGGVGVLLVLTLAAVAILVYQLRHNDGGGLWSTVIAPVMAAGGLVGVCVVCLSNYATMLGVAPGHPLTWIFPTAYAVILAGGLIWGLIMRFTGHPAYLQIGNGAAVAPATVATTGAAR
jgi:amino acid transporter